MSIFSRKRKNTTNTITKNEEQERLDGGDYGIHFPWVSVIFLLVGIASEVTDALLLHAALGELVTGFEDWEAYLVSAITGAVCFFSMAAIGYQSANSKIKYRTKVVEILIWLAVGIYIASLRIFLAIKAEGVASLSALFSNQNTIMSFLQLLLYIGTGFMTYSSSKQLTNAKLYEYIMAKREYNSLLNEIATRRKYINDGIYQLSLYPNYTKRLIESKDGVLGNVGQYNESVKALCAAKMAVSTEPDQMDDMYESALAKEKAEKENC